MSNVRSLVAAAGLALGLVAPAFAAYDWNQSLGSCGISTNSSSPTVGAADCGLVTVEGMSAADQLNAPFSSRSISYANGYGLSVHGESGDSHAIDNVGRVEAVLLHFDSSVILSEVVLGWRNNDWDFTVHAYTQATPDFDGDIGGLSLANPLDAGWSLIGNYAANPSVEPACSSNCTGSNALTRAVNSGQVSSSWWVISAYDTTWGTGSALGEGNDKFKLLALAGNNGPSTPPPNNGVPEPGSLALAAVALAGLGLRRRLRSQA